MLGSVRWNLASGISGMLLTFLASFGNNGFAVSCLRGLYAFIAFFMLGYLIRVVLRGIVGTAPSEDWPDIQADPSVGGQVDFSTPDEGEDLNGLLRAQLDGSDNASGEAVGFAPFQPKKLASTQNLDPEELANALRHLSDSKE
ncbi:hypothetical protein BG53_11785 [Paenibacillus darwinianus]|uniref:Uncharacterized protein n=1 Tax=Paenibacillus darwinianus TaxID=1380763 RepID=A0A9W5S248_9BACL|nr:hypothetical protein [Paenibacillus darwinianus]EXX91268.1 hypothetical protein BG53_11785 [Paenibacillus darwinianus]EXX92206.1 hypothetical protein BG52_15185 [Paenibacillus darwinianus]EXX92816.1 hypothetical protein CH50_12090 [Paenibacillus darwinianus]